MPEISVIIPAHNVGPYIKDAIISLQNQSFDNFEAWVINDASEDRTGVIAKAAIAGDCRFQVIDINRHCLSAARNIGLERATARFIAFLDGDDLLHPSFLTKLHNLILSYDVPWVACGVSFLEDHGQKSEHSAIHGSPQITDDRPTLCEYPLTDWPAIIRHFPSAWNKLYDRAFIGKSRFDEAIRYEDHLFFQRLALGTKRLPHINEPLYIYRVGRPGQITGLDDERVFEQFDVLEKCAKIIYSSDKGSPDTGLAQLATRLFNERLDAISNPARTRRFVKQVTAFFQRHNLQPDWRWDPYLSASRSASFMGKASVLIKVDKPENSSVFCDTRISLEKLLPWYADIKFIVAPESEENSAIADARDKKYLLDISLVADEFWLPDELIRVVDCFWRHNCQGVITLRSGVPLTGIPHDTPFLMTPELALSLNNAHYVIISRDHSSVGLGIFSTQQQALKLCGKPVVFLNTFVTKSKYCKYIQKDIIYDHQLSLAHNLMHPIRYIKNVRSAVRVLEQHFEQCSYHFPNQWKQALFRQAIKARIVTARQLEQSKYQSWLWGCYWYFWMILFYWFYPLFAKPVALLDESQRP